MSIIFKALEKLEHPLAETRTEPEDGGGGGRPVHRRLFPRAFLAGIVVTVFAGGFAAVFGAQYLKTTVKSVPDQTTAIAAVSAAAPETVIAGPGGDAMLESADSPVDAQLQYVPPQPAVADAVTAAEPVAAEAPADRGGMTDEKTDIVESPPTLVTATVQSAAGPHSDTGLQAAVDRPISPKELKDDTAEKGVKYSPAFSGGPAVRTYPRIVPGAQVTRSGHTRVDPAARKNRVSALVQRLHGAMARMDRTETEEILGSLTRIKGEDDLFILKMRAYWLLRTAQYDAAGALLTRILSRVPGDREAGVNMAVVEINTGRIFAARNRLMGLNESYPENTVISQMLRKVE